MRRDPKPDAPYGPGDLSIKRCHHLADFSASAPFVAFQPVPKSRQEQGFAQTLTDCYLAWEVIRSS